MTEYPRIVLLTGLSGSGKSTCANALEDLGFFVVDNLPSGLLPTLLTLLEENAQQPKVALVMDIRDSEFPGAFDQILERAAASGHRLEVAYLEANDRVLVRRFSETRRKHPLDVEGDLKSAIDQERAMLLRVREKASIVIDTSELNVHELRKRIVKEFSEELTGEQMRVRIVSFGFRWGAPLGADVLMDVRFLPNPHFIPEMRDRTGKEADVAAKVLETEDGRGFMERFDGMLEFLLPRYRSEGKATLTIGIGCTGGKHRSVAVSEAIAEKLRVRGDIVSVVHRDIERN